MLDGSRSSISITYKLLEQTDTVLYYSYMLATDSKPGPF